MVRKLKSGVPAQGNSQGDILKRAQAMQQEMLKVQDELKEKTLEVSVGGGAITAKVNGQKELISIKLSDEIVKEAAEDKEMLEDLIVSAVAEAMRQAQEMSDKEMEKLTGGISIPGLF